MKGNVAWPDSFKYVWTMNRGIEDSTSSDLSLLCRDGVLLRGKYTDQENVDISVWAATNRTRQKETVQNTEIFHSSHGTYIYSILFKEKSTTEATELIGYVMMILDQLSKGEMDEEYELMTAALLGVVDSLTTRELSTLFIDDIRRLVQTIICFLSSDRVEHPDRIQLTLVTIWRVFVKSDKVAALWSMVEIIKAKGGTLKSPLIADLLVTFMDDYAVVDDHCNFWVSCKISFAHFAIIVDHIGLFIAKLDVELVSKEVARILQA